MQTITVLSFPEIIGGAGIQGMLILLLRITCSALFVYP